MRHETLKPTDVQDYSETLLGNIVNWIEADVPFITEQMTDELHAAAVAEVARREAADKKARQNAAEFEMMVLEARRRNAAEGRRLRAAVAALAYELSKPNNAEGVLNCLTMGTEK